MLAVSLQQPWQLSKSPVTFGGVKPSHRASLGRKGAKGAVHGVFWVWISEGTAKIWGVKPASLSFWVETFKQFALKNKMAKSLQVLEVFNAVISCSSWFFFGLNRSLFHSCNMRLWQLQSHGNESCKPYREERWSRAEQRGHMAKENNEVEERLYVRRHVMVKVWSMSYHTYWFARGPLEPRRNLRPILASQAHEWDVPAVCCIDPVCSKIPGLLASVSVWFGLQLYYASYCLLYIWIVHACVLLFLVPTCGQNCFELKKLPSTLLSLKPMLQPHSSFTIAACVVAVHSLAALAFAWCSVSVLQVTLCLPFVVLAAAVAARILRGNPPTMDGTRVGLQKKQLFHHAMESLMGSPDLPQYALVAMPINHFGERIRWALDLIGAPYEEFTVAGLLSVFLRGRSVPYLIDRKSNSMIGNSDECLATWPWKLDVSYVDAMALRKQLKKHEKANLSHVTCMPQRFQNQLLSRP